MNIIGKDVMFCMLGQNHIAINTAAAVTFSATVLEWSQSDNDELYRASCDVLNFFCDWGDLPTTPVVIMGVVAFFIGTLLPDIDSKSSMMGRLIYLPFGHRTWTHTVWALLLLGGAAWVCPVVRWLWAGYGLHLVVDAVSRCGVCWFYPISKYRSYGDAGAKIKYGHRLWLYRAGGPAEYVIVALAWCGAITYLYILYF